jgi:hypothetical protein
MATDKWNRQINFEIFAYEKNDHKKHVLSLKIMSMSMTSYFRNYIQAKKLWIYLVDEKARKNQH